LLRAHGHIHPERYPIGKLFAESEFVTERINNDTVTRTIAIQLAVSSGMGSKKAKKLLDKMINELRSKN
jgi:hypothetical protein